MKNTDLKALIKNAYSVEPSEKKEAFINAHRRRELNYKEMLYLQLQYLGPQMTAVCGYALAILLTAAADIDVGLARSLAAFMPAAALVALTGLGRSVKYAMAEIEMATRFSLRMIRALRLAIIGIAGTSVMLAVSVALKAAMGADLLSTFAFVGIPYLATTFLCMLLIRGWHSEKNIYGCAAIACGVGLSMFKGIGLMAVGTAVFRGGLLWLLLMIFAVLTVAEGCKYVKESEDLQWNLC